MDLQVLTPSPKSVIEILIFQVSDDQEKDPTKLYRLEGKLKRWCELTRVTEKAVSYQNRVSFPTSLLNKFLQMFCSLKHSLIPLILFQDPGE